MGLNSGWALAPLTLIEIQTEITLTIARRSAILGALRHGLEGRFMRGTLFAFIVLAGCNSRPDKPDPFKPVPECTGATVAPFMGSRQLVVSSLALADFNEGFDLDLNG